MRFLRYLILYSTLCVLAIPAWAQDDAALTRIPFTEATLTLKDGTSATYASLKGERGTLLIVWEASCAWAKRHQERIAALRNALETAQVNAYLVHTPSNPALQLRMPKSDEEDPLAWMPGIDDADQVLTKQLQATRIPQFFLADATDAIVYAGALDDSPGNAEQVQSPYLSAAIDALVAGVALDVAQTRPFGCMIR